MKMITVEQFFIALAIISGTVALIYIIPVILKWKNDNYIKGKFTPSPHEGGVHPSVFESKDSDEDVDEDVIPRE